MDSLAKTNPELVEEWDFEKNNELGLSPETVTAGSTMKVNWKCKKCGYSWRTSIRKRTKNKPTNCPKCAPKLNRASQVEKQIKEKGSLGDLFPELLKEWDYELNMGLDPYKLTTRNSRKVNWVCEYGHKWQTSISARTRVNRTGCPYCSGRLAICGETDFETLNPILMREWDYEYNNKNKIFACELTKCNPTKVGWICPICDYHYVATVSHRVNGTACPKCANQMKTSFPEQAIFFYLKKNFSNVENRWNDLGKEIDVFVPEIKVGIEYDGAYFHNTNAAIKREEEKYNKLKAMGITLIRVREKGLETSYADYSLKLEKRNNDKTLEEVIKQIIDIIEITTNKKCNKDINISRDRAEIYSQYIVQIKENSIENKYPELVKEWDYEKNIIKPNQVTIGSGLKAWWKCNLGHSYEQNIRSHIFGSGCPYCTNVKVLPGFNDLSTLYPEIAKEWDYEKNDTTPDTILPHSNKVYFWRCSQGHSYKARPNSKCREGINHEYCPICHGKKVLEGYNDLSTLRPDIAKEWNYKKNKTLPTMYTLGSKKKVWWTCPRGHDFYTSVQQRTRPNGTKCPICNGKQLIKGLNDFASQYPDLLRDWDYDKNTINPEDIFIRSYIRVHWKCSICGNEWSTALCDRTRDNKGCNRCSSIRGGEKNRKRLVSIQGSLGEKCPELLKEWDYDNNTISPYEITPGSHIKTYWICSICGLSWETEARQRGKYHHGCPHCGRKKNK